MTEVNGHNHRHVHVQTHMGQQTTMYNLLHAPNCAAPPSLYKAKITPIIGDNFLLK